eukprot:1319098-Amorphochlora_amoeboformis.AAC.2
MDNQHQLRRVSGQECPGMPGNTGMSLEKSIMSRTRVTNITHMGFDEGFVGGLHDDDHVVE